MSLHIIWTNCQRALKSASRRREVPLRSQVRTQITPRITIKWVEYNRPIHRCNGIGKATKCCQQVPVVILNTAIPRSEGQRLLLIRLCSGEIQRKQLGNGARAVAGGKLRCERNSLFGSPARAIESPRIAGLGGGIGFR